MIATSIAPWLAQAAAFAIGAACAYVGAVRRMAKREADADAALADVRHALGRCEAERDAATIERDSLAKRLAGVNRDLEEMRARWSRADSQFEAQVQQTARDAHAAVVAEQSLGRCEADATVYLGLAESYAADADRLRAGCAMILAAFGRGV